MKETWNKIVFETLFLIPTRNGLTKPKSIRGEGYKFINMGELFSNDRISNLNMDLVPLNDNEKRNYNVEVNDLMFARQSLIASGAGKCSIVKGIDSLTVFDSHIIRVRLNPKYSNSDFYYYYFKSGISGIKSLVQQGVQAGIRASDLAKLEVISPPLPIQRRIAAILSAYDDLIENNLKRIKLLEEAAQNIYKEWFVHFRFPGHEQTRMGENGLPEGWESVNIESLCEVSGGGTPSTQIEKYWENGNILWFSPTDLSKNNSIVLLDSAKKITEAGLASSSAKLLPERTILMSSRATIGLFGIISKPCCTNQGFINIIPHNKWELFYMLFNLIHRKEEIESHASGTTFKEISKKNFKVMPILRIPKELAISFGEITGIMIDQIEVLEKNINLLKETRDILLPRLMNQTIEV